MDTVSRLLNENKDILVRMSEELLEKETIVLKDMENMIEELRPGQYTSRIKKRRSAAEHRTQQTQSEPAEPAEPAKPTVHDEAPQTEEVRSEVPPVPPTATDADVSPSAPEENRKDPEA
jgi:cell division protease FtsH